TCYGDLDRSWSAKAENLADDVRRFKGDLRSRQFLGERPAQTFSQVLASRSFILYRNLDDRFTWRTCKLMDQEDGIIWGRHTREVGGDDDIVGSDLPVNDVQSVEHRPLGLFHSRSGRRFRSNAHQRT